MRCRTIGLAALVGAALSASADAGEVRLKFRLVTTDTNATLFQAAGDAGRAVSAHEAVGVAVFDDGRLAFKQFVYTEDATEAEGKFNGYSTYTFEDGDSLTAKFTGGWSALGLGGSYEVLSGTGAYAGATGTGAYEAAGQPWGEGANLFDGSFVLQLPGT